MNQSGPDDAALLAGAAGISDQLLYGAIGRVSALDSQAKTSADNPYNPLLTPLSQQYKPGIYGSYWACVCTTATGYTPGTDWTPIYGDPSGTQVFYTIPASSGRFLMLGDKSGGSGSTASMAVARVFSTNQMTLNGYLRMQGGGSPRVQLHCNGSYTEYIASGAFSVILRGSQVNLLQVMTNLDVGSVEVLWQVWDGITNFWVDPNVAPGSSTAPGGGDFGSTGGTLPAGALFGAGLLMPAGSPEVPEGAYQSSDDVGSVGSGGTV